MIKKICFGIFLILALFLAVGMIQNQFVKVAEVNIKDEKLRSVLKDKVVLHLTDLHINSIGKKEKKVIEIINSLKPDIIFLTGDYVTWNGDYKPALDFLDKLHAKSGVWAVTGDYDYSNSRKSCTFCHVKGTGKMHIGRNIRFLKNSIEPVNIDGKQVFIAGVDNRSDKIHDNLLIKDSSVPVILLCHEPLNFELVDEDINLFMLAGDTHGGQIPLPKWVWKILGYEKNEKFNYGLFVKGKKKMFVSRGIGTSHLPVRLFCSPEITVLKFY